MYIAFKGSEELDDWTVNADVTPCRFEKLKRFPQAQVHRGFYKRAKLWLDPEGEIMKMMGEWDPKRIITTGHSLGAAVSSMVHVLLVRGSHAEPMKSLEYHNIGFATPLFGNLDFKKAILSLSRSDARLKNMYHFVNCDDIVPAVAIIEDVYANLTTGVSIWANRAKSLIGMKY